jgi:hypothetical protein
MQFEFPLRLSVSARKFFDGSWEHRRVSAGSIFGIGYAPPIMPDFRGTSVSIYCTDLVRSVQFYERVLGAMPDPRTGS